ncbi:hypothetical protein IAT38_008300 [Cryptococcus sp. DSM 104549]
MPFSNIKSSLSTLLPSRNSKARDRQRIDPFYPPISRPFNPVPILPTSSGATTASPPRSSAAPSPHPSPPTASPPADGAAHRPKPPHSWSYHYASAQGNFAEASAKRDGPAATRPEKTPSKRSLRSLTVSENEHQDLAPPPGAGYGADGGTDGFFADPPSVMWRGCKAMHPRATYELVQARRTESVPPYGSDETWVRSEVAGRKGWRRRHGVV